MADSLDGGGNRRGDTPARRRWSVTALALVLLAASASSVAARPSSPPPTPAFERNVSDTGDWHGGEPEIAVNPRNTNNVVMVWPEEDATGVYRNPATGTFNTATGTVGYAADHASSRCGLGVSWDGGLTWQRSVLPGQTAQSTLCSDATVTAGPDGTFYAMFITFNQPTNPIPGVPPGTLPHVSNFQPGQGSADAVISSTDGGRTWTFPPVDAIGNRGNDAERYAPGSNPETGGEGTCDRPWIAVDQSTNTVFVSATADTIQFNGSPRTESWVTSSTDHARSFGTVYPVDDAVFPQTGASTISAANGMLAVAYIGHEGSSSTNVVIFETSRDGGHTFNRHVLAAPVSASGVLGVNVAADPARPGDYAVMVPSTDETGVLVYRTVDEGQTWSVPTAVAVGTDRPWMAYSPNGHALGVMGRDTHSDKSQDILAAFSYDNGAHFDPPVKANAATTPPPPPATLDLYDDVSWITMTDRYAFIAWGDWRKTPGNPNGENNAWMARVPLTAGDRRPSP